MSGEHIISQALFEEKMIVVKGFKWCADEAKSVSKASLTRNILCRTHNSQLSELGSAAKQAFDVFREATRLMMARSGINAKSIAFKKFSVNGRLLERWFLKTLINVAWGVDLIIGLGQHPAGTPSIELVEAAFGRRDLPEPAGLYLSARTGDSVTFEDRVQIITRRDTNYLGAAEFLFRGCRFFLSLVPTKFAMDGSAQLLYRDSKMNFQVYNHRRRLLLSHQIALRWQ